MASRIGQSGRVPAVVHEHCDACGFDGSVYDDASLIAALRELGPRWRRLLAGAGTELRLRPAPKVWSAIEYAAHSRDITALHGFGVEQALTGEEPVYPDIAGADLIAAAAAGYLDLDPDAVVDALDTAAGHLAELAAAAPAERWESGITIGADRSTVRRLLEHALHDSQHHLGDVERGLSLLRG
jgi:S-DNA-T family DNA segregation ATPase FtsK/SpoIIIE